MGLYSFAYRDGDILCYPDLIQVGIGLDRGKDTLTYSSVATDEATVCISRSFADLRGHEVGEQDIVMPVPVGEDYYEVLAFCAACAALGLADLL